MCSFEFTAHIVTKIKLCRAINAIEPCRRCIAIFPQKYCSKRGGRAWLAPGLRPPKCAGSTIYQLPRQSSNVVRAIGSARALICMHQNNQEIKMQAKKCRQRSFCIATGHRTTRNFSHSAYIQIARYFGMHVCLLRYTAIVLAIGNWQLAFGI